MKIVHVIFSYNTGGAEQLLVDTLKRQCDKGHQVTLMVINNTYNAELLKSIDDRVKIRIIGRPEGSHNPFWIAKYNIQLSNEHPDIVHFHNEKTRGLTYLARRAKKVQTIHSTGLALPYANKIDKLIAISPAVAEDLSSRLGLESVIINNGIVTDSITESETGRAKNSPFKLLCVGRFNLSHKGQDVLIKALPGVIKSHDDVLLTFMGGGVGEPYCKNLSAELGIDNHIIFSGDRARADVYAHIRDYDLFVLPSRIEGFGLAIVEAMAAKVPVLVCDLKGPMEIIDNGRFGEHFKSEDSDDLSAKIVSVYENYAEHKKIADTSAYIRAQEYGIDVTVDKYDELYRSLCE